MLSLSLRGSKRMCPCQGRAVMKQENTVKRFIRSRTILMSLAVSLMALATFSTPMVAAHSAQPGAAATKIPVSVHRSGVNTPVSGRAFNVYQLPKATGTNARTSGQRQVPFLPIKGASQFAAAKAAVAHTTHAPKAAPMSGPQTLSTQHQFQGMQDSATICPYFGGCQPPDMALASSPQYVAQLVNTSFELFTTTGHSVAGPINLTNFYGVPNPPNNCDPAGPFLSDPRAFYDPNTGFFWTATLQVEGAFGIAPNCPLLSLYWISNFNPTTGAGHVYHFEMTLGTTQAADYTQFGFNKSVIAFSGNMFDTTGGNTFYAEAGFANKTAMQQGKPVTATFFTGFSAGGVIVDTVQPVETITPKLLDPGVEYLVNSFNGDGDPFGDDCFNTACHGFVVWAYNPATHSISGTVMDSNPYIIPPNADQPGCSQCVETIDARITGTPVYSVGSGNGLISFSLDTAVQNGALSIVPGIFWGQIQPVLSGGSVVFAGMYQSGYLAFAGDQAASFGAMMQDKNGRLVMVFDTMSAFLNPSIMYAVRLKTDPLGSLRLPHFLIKGTVSTFDSRWGDYEAASYDGFSANHIWVASEYSIGDWATFIARV